MKVWVYILECADGRYFVGTYSGKDMDVRVSEHNAGKYPEAWTCSRRPVTLVWAEHYPNADQAIAVERKLKGWSRAKKEAVIQSKWRMLPMLSERKPKR